MRDLLWNGCDLGKLFLRICERFQNASLFRLGAAELSLLCKPAALLSSLASITLLACAPREAISAKTAPARSAASSGMMRLKTASLVPTNAASASADAAANESNALMMSCWT